MERDQTNLNQDIPAMFRKLSTFLLGVLIFFGTFTTAQAQFGIGGSYEIRNQTPETGFGVRIEKGIGLPIPLVKLGVRASASHFSKDNQITRDNGVSFEYDRSVTSIDYGVTLLGKVQLGFVKPYVGVGVGGTRSNMEIDNIRDIQDTDPNLPDAGDLDDIEKSEFTYHGIIGGEFSLIPLLNPFIEYRVNNYSPSLNIESSQDQIEESIKGSNGRIMFGVMLRF